MKPHPVWRRRSSLPTRPGLALAACVTACLGSGPKASEGAPPARIPRPSVAFSPDGAHLAVAGYRIVTLVDSATGRETAKLAGHPGAVTCVAFSPDGKTLAASGGVPGRSGEIRLWDLQTTTARVLSGLHADAVHSVAWAPDSRTLAASSYDRLVSLWDTGTGQGRPLKDHTDAVYAVAFSPDGRRIASASGDRTVKVWDAATGKRLFTLSDATAEVYSVAFHPSGKEIAAGGVDRMLRKWSVSESSGTLVRSAFAHDGPVLRVLYTPDGEGIYTSSEDRTVRLWDADTLVEKQVLERQSDWGMGLALNRDASTLAVSRYDGSAALYDAASGAKQRDLLRAGTSKAQVAQ